MTFQDSVHAEKDLHKRNEGIQVGFPGQHAVVAKVVQVRSLQSLGDRGF